MEVRATTAYGCCVAEIKEYIPKQHSIWHTVGTQQVLNFFCASMGDRIWWFLLIIPWVLWWHCYCCLTSRQSCTFPWQETMIFFLNGVWAWILLKAEPEIRLVCMLRMFIRKVILGTRNEGLRRVGQKRKTGQLKSMLSRSLLWTMEVDSTWTFYEACRMPLKDETHNHFSVGPVLQWLEFVLVPHTSKLSMSASLFFFNTGSFISCRES